MPNTKIKLPQTLLIQLFLIVGWQNPAYSLTKLNFGFTKVTPKLENGWKSHQKLNDVKPLIEGLVSQNSNLAKLYDNGSMILADTIHADKSIQPGVLIYLPRQNGLVEIKMKIPSAIDTHNSIISKIELLNDSEVRIHRGNFNSAQTILFNGPGSAEIWTIGNAGKSSKIYSTIKSKTVRFKIDNLEFEASAEITPQGNIAYKQAVFGDTSLYSAIEKPIKAEFLTNLPENVYVVDLWLIPQQNRVNLLSSEGILYEYNWSRKENRFFKSEHSYNTALIKNYRANSIVYLNEGVKFQEGMFVDGIGAPLSEGKVPSSSTDVAL